MLYVYSFVLRIVKQIFYVESIYLNNFGLYFWLLRNHSTDSIRSDPIRFDSIAFSKIWKETECCRKKVNNNVAMGFFCLFLCFFICCVVWFRFGFVVVGWFFVFSLFVLLLSFWNLVMNKQQQQTHKLTITKGILFFHSSSSVN